MPFINTPQLPRGSVPNPHPFIPTRRHDNASSFAENNVAHEVRVREPRFTRLEGGAAEEAEGVGVRGGGVEVAVVRVRGGGGEGREEEFVDGSFVREDQRVGHVDFAAAAARGVLAVGGVGDFAGRGGGDAPASDLAVGAGGEEGYFLWRSRFVCRDGGGGGPFVVVVVVIVR